MRRRVQSVREKKKKKKDARRIFFFFFFYAMRRGYAFARKMRCWRHAAKATTQPALLMPRAQRYAQSSGTVPPTERPASAAPHRKMNESDVPRAYAQKGAMRGVV